MLQAGEIDACVPVPAPRMAELRRPPAIAPIRKFASATYDMLINHEKALFNNLKFRQAIHYPGIDRKAICDAVTMGTGTPATSIFSLWTLDYFDEVAAAGRPRRREV